MIRAIFLSLICSLLPVDVFGQYYLRLDYRFYRDRVYGSGEALRCRGYDRNISRERSTAKIVIGQNLVNGTHIELSSCSMIGRTECFAKLVSDGCGLVNSTCSIVRNETEEKKVTREIFIADEASIESFYIRYKGVNNENTTQVFPSETLIQLVCCGDVSIIDNEVLKNLTLTWSNGFLKTQDPPSVETTRIFDENCKASQTVSSFLYLKGEQLDTEISCKTAYFRTYYSRGRIRMQRKTIRIKTIPERGEILGPVVVYKDELEDRSLLSLTCKTTTDPYNSTGVEDIKWCIRKENNTQFVPLPLQQDPLLESFNRSKEKTLKSSVLYQLLKSDENVVITCEANHSNTCGSGTLRGKVHFDSHPMERTNNFLQSNKYFGKNDTRVMYVDSDQPNTLMYASASVMIASIIILITAVVAFCKARERVKYETSKTSLNVVAANKVDLPKANTYTSNRNNPVSDVRQNQTSSEDKTYSNVPAHLGGTNIGVYESTEGGGKGNVYEPLEVHDIEQHVYEEKLKTSEVYEEV